MSGTLLDLLGDELSGLLAPIGRVVDGSWPVDRLLEHLGANADSFGGAALVAALRDVDALRSQITTLAADPSPSLSQVVAVLDAARNLFAALRGLQLGGVPSAAVASLLEDLVGLLVVRHLGLAHPLALQIAVLLTLIEAPESAALRPGIVDANKRIYRTPFQLQRVRLDQLPALLHDPVGALRAEYGPRLATVADANATADKLFPRVANVLDALGISSRYGLRSEDTAPLADAAGLLDHALAIYVAEELAGADADAGVLLTLSSADRGDLGLVVSPFGTLAFSKLVGAWKVDLGFTAGVQAVAIGRHGVTLVADPAVVDVSGSLAATLPASTDGPAFVLGARNGTRLEIGSARASLGVAWSASRRSVTMEAGASNAALVIGPGDGDGFLAALLPSNGLRVDFDLGLAWSNDAGLRFEGAAGLDATLPVQVSVGPFTVQQVQLGLHASGAGMDAQLSASAQVAIGPVRLVVDGVGLSTQLAFSPSGGNLGVADLALRFKPPNGIGLSIDAPVVSGGGFLKYAPDQGQYAGALHVNIEDKIDLAAWGVLQTGSPTQHWSLAIFLAGHIPPIELGWGFRLTGLGGMLALHRRMDTDALRDAAYGIRGSLDDLLFPDSPETRLPQLLSAIDRFFPRQADSYVAGPMVEIEWGPKVQVNARIRAALLLQLGDFKAALYGTVRVGFPNLDTDSTLRLRAGIEALYDPREQMARFAINVLEAKLFGSIDLTGGAAFLVRWGETKEFAFTLGGFHPQYRPFIPKGLIEPPRMGIHWNPVSGVHLDLQQYFAITSTSMQFGAAAHAEIGCDWGGVRGDFAFDVLVLTDPRLHIEADLSARLTVSAFGCDLLSAGFDGSLVGPGPWQLSGDVSFKVWIFHHTESFSFEWGDRPAVGVTTQSAAQLLSAEVQSPGNWTSFRASALPVQLRHGVTAPLAPCDQIEVRQAKLPFGTRVEVYEGNSLSDPGVWALTTTSASATKLADVTDIFPEQRFLSAPSKEQPFRADLVCGARFGRSDWEVPDSAMQVASNATDDLILDGSTKVPGDVNLPALAPAAVAAFAVSADAPARRWTRLSARLESAS